MQKTIHLELGQVPATLKGGYSGKKFKAIVTESIRVPIDAGLWSGGSRDTYSFVELATGRSVPSPAQSSAPWSGERQEFDSPLPVGIVMVEHSIFCGKDMGLTFYVHPQNSGKFLPPPAVLSDHEKLVLEATRSLKASYAGKDRYENAKPYGAMSESERDERLARVQGILDTKGDVKLKSGKYASERLLELERINTFFPSRAEWDAAKDSLIAKGLLNKAGAITVAGRNAIPGL